VFFALGIVRPRTDFEISQAQPFTTFERLSHPSNRHKTQATACCGDRSSGRQHRHGGRCASASAAAAWRGLHLCSRRARSRCVIMRVAGVECFELACPQCIVGFAAAGASPCAAPHTPPSISSLNPSPPSPPPPSPPKQYRSHHPDPHRLRGPGDR